MHLDTSFVETAVKKVAATEGDCDIERAWVKVLYEEEDKEPHPAGRCRSNVQYPQPTFGPSFLHASPHWLHASVRTGAPECWLSIDLNSSVSFDGTRVDRPRVPG